jgi:transaldolase/glucose-6-phosphate isomerase
MTNPLRQLEAAGQAVWLDYLHRKILENGELKRLIDDDGIKGLTSNPSIFEKAIGEGDAYEEAVRAALRATDGSTNVIYERLVIADIQDAADIFRPTWDRLSGADGYVSLEVSPKLANDTEGTIAEARRLWRAVGRPNLMIKVPGAPAGAPAIRQLIAEGVNVNVTLLFGIDAYLDVAEAHIHGVEAAKAAGLDISRIHGVASFFVSRIDTKIDKAIDARLAENPASEEALRLKRLRGKIGIANAKRAYQRYLEIIETPRWRALADAGACPQRVLWASTGVKDPSFPDTLYADSLIGPDTIDTLPPATMDAFRDHGRVSESLTSGVAEAEHDLAEAEDLGLDLDAVTDTLVVEGVEQFAKAFDKLFASIAERRREILTEAEQTIEIDPGSDEAKGAFATELERWREGGLVRRLWAGDKTLWTSDNEDRWLGWLDIVERELGDIGELQTFAAEVKALGYSDVVLLGMGGSSLGPEVLAECFGRQAGWPRFHMLDSTDPAQIAAIEQAVDLKQTLFITSSKSGGTLEPNIFTDYFLASIGAVLGEAAAPRRFVAVTDPGSPLEARAKAAGFWRIFHGVPTIGGRYSALSKFGLVPAAAMGIDVRRLLETTRAMQRACGPDVPPGKNPGVQLGILLGVAARALGRDKVTIAASPGIADLAAWLEQLLAESTGKQGRGLIPITGEPLGPPGVYGSDRVFVYLELEGHADRAQREAANALARAGHPLVRITIKDTWSLGEEFFRWETATAVAGAVMGINPFDQPDVEASKDKTRALTQQYESTRALPSQEPVFRENGIALYADPRNAAELGRHNTLTGYLKSHFGRVHDGDYVAFLAYVDRDDAHTATLTEARGFVRDKTRAATCLGFGPRFQHSTGQAYKGGPNSGVFLQITCDDPKDIEVPGHGYSFGVVKAAQARGDLDVLVERGRRTLRVHLKDADAGLPELVRAVTEALA